jgi:hypothetical protein
MGQEPCLRVPRCRPGLENLFERSYPGVLIEPVSSERTVLPRPYLQLAAVDRLLHVDACLGESAEMFFASRGINEVERFISPLEAVLHERVKHAVLLVHAVEERANVTMLAERASRNLLGIGGGIHLSPPR